MFFRKLKERVLLLEYENEIMARKLKNLEEEHGPIKPVMPPMRSIREDGYDLSYSTLRKKYRKHSIKFDDGL